MAGLLTIKAQKIEVTNVTDVIVTVTQQDTVEGTFVREIRIITTESTEDAQPVETFVLRLVSDERDSINVTAPAVDF